MKMLIFDELNGNGNSLAVFKQCLKLFNKLDKPRFHQLVNSIINNCITSAKKQLLDFPDKVLKMASLVTNINFINPKEYSVLLYSISTLMKGDFFINFNDDKSGK